MMNSTQNHVPAKISDKLQSAIIKSLEEEKKPKARQLTKVLLLGSAVTFILACILFGIYSNHINAVWYIACAFGWVLLLTGFYLYFYPEPKIAVRGLWNKWVIAKVLLAMTVISALELVICPHFAFVHMQVPGLAIFENLTSHYMAVGGMAGCMFLCGLTFSGIAALFSFLFISKTLSGSSLRSFLPVAGIALLAQLPVMILQLAEHHLRPYFIFWLIGSAMAIFMIAYLVRFIFSLRRI
jgi:hypothetical protein